MQRYVEYQLVMIEEYETAKRWLAKHMASVAMLRPN